MQKKIFQVPTVLQNRSFFNVVILYIYICTQIDVNVDDDLDDDVDDDDDDVDDVDDDDDDDDDGYGILRIAYGIWHMAST